ncbi:glycohydrolase toxin TNT-related protein [Mycobacterium sp.]|uniref:glycohydrolase toxin TNT-related protein n=1 Tax=Mycobacterium sp. TaxID=1785 RepID=UPI0011F66218|nr:glycohydrolase toxin TNT-related protein [Mycobacterium sp.]TAM67331.1 MAG: DUF4237 domain-containing protein [Mycobacterium sp.]
MAPLAVDPEAMYAAGSAVVAAGDGLAASLTVLTAGFSAHTGLDAAGTTFGLAYQDAAEQLLKAAAAGVNACRQCGARIRQGAANYSRVEAASTLGGGAGVLQAPSEPPNFTPPGPPGTWGKGEPPPLLWAVVESFVDDVWPDGDVAALHAAAARWRSFGATVSGMKNALSASKSLFDGQHIPEGDKIDDALSKVGDCLAQIGEQSGKLATNLDKFADEVNQAHHHIRDLLNRLGSLSDLGHDLMLIVKGDALDEIKKIAQDIDGVLHDLGREARAGEQMVKGGMQVVDGLIVKLEKYTRGQLKDFLGEAVGNQVATVFDTWLNANEGVLKGAVGMAVSMGDLLPVWGAVDPDGYAATWTGLAKNVWKGSLFNAVLNPKEAGDTELQQIKSLLHLEDWRRDRPGLGAGENLFDLATLLIPGAGEAGAAVDGAGAATRGAEAEAAAGRAGAAEGLGGLARARAGLTDITRAGGDLTKNLEGVTKDLPKVEPPSGTPVAVPTGKPIEAPVESAPRPADAAPDVPQTSAKAPHEPASVPAEGPREPASVPAGAPHEPASAPAVGSPAAAGERLPSALSQPFDHSPSVSPSGSPSEAAPLTAHAPAPSPASPHFAAPEGHPAEVPMSGNGWHGPGEGGPPGEHAPGEPHGGDPSGHGDGDAPGDRSNGEGSPGQDVDDGGTGETPDGNGGAHEQPTPVKIPGVDYPLPTSGALGVLDHPGAELQRLADGGIPRSILDGYEPLAGRTVEEFNREFTIKSVSGERIWDWDVQAPKNGFAGIPFESNHIPVDLHLDRVGPNGGGFLSPEGVPLAERATPPGLAAQYHAFEGTGREIPPGKDWVVQHGPAKEAFGQPGGGDQWIVFDKSTGRPVPVDELIQRRLLKEITPPK